MFKIINLRGAALATALACTALTASAQDTITNPAIDPETIAALQEQIATLETQLDASGQFVEERQPELLDLATRIENAEADTQAIIDDLRNLADQFRTGSAIQIAVRDAMEDVEGYIETFIGGSSAQQAAAAQLQVTLESMRETDNRRNAAVDRALREIRRLEAMQDDLVALRIAGAFQDMQVLYDQMVSDFEATVAEAGALADGIENLTVMPVQ